MKNEKMLEVKINKSFDVINKEWKNEIFLNLFMSFRTSGMLADISAANLKALINLVTFMNEDGECFPSLEQLAEGLGISVPSASERYSSLCKYQWNGKPLVKRKKIRDKKTKQIKGTVYTVLTDNFETVHENEEEEKPTSGKPEVESTSGKPTLAKPEVDQTPVMTPTSGLAKVGEPESGKPEGNCLFVSEFVREWVVPIQELWRIAFKEEISPLKIERLIHYGEKSGLNPEGIIENIKDIYANMKPIEPYSVVLECVKQGGWEWDTEKAQRPEKPKSKRIGEPNKKQPSRKSWKPNQREDKLPRAVLEEIEDKENRSWGEADPEAEARIRAKLNRMRQRMSQRKSEVNNG